MYITRDVQLVNVAVLSVRFFFFSSSVISNILPFPSLRRMLQNMHPLVDELRRKVEGEMWRKREGERLMFTKEISMSERFPFCASMRVEDN